MNDDMNSLILGYVPDKFNYCIKQKDELDWSKVQYTNLYRNPLFYLNRMPNPTAFINLPFNSGIIILEEIANNSLSPIEEYNLGRCVPPLEKLEGKATLFF